MKKCNVIGVLSPDGREWLMCLRAKEPYKGLYNLVGGKIEPGETGEEYYLDDTLLEFWAGRLKEPAALREEKNPLRWFPLTEDFFDASRFAGDGNIGHMLLQLRAAGLA